MYDTLLQVITWAFDNKIADLIVAAWRHLACGDTGKAHMLLECIERWERVKRNRICRLYSKLG